MACAAGFSFFVPSLLTLIHGIPAGDDTVCADGVPAGRQSRSFEVRTSTFQSARVSAVCHRTTRLSWGDNFGASPSWRYGFSRKGPGSGGAKASASTTAANDPAARMRFFIRQWSPPRTCNFITLYAFSPHLANAPVIPDGALRADLPTASWERLPLVSE